MTKYKKNSCDSYYNIPSIFNGKKPNGPSYSFGISRDFYDKVFCDSNIQFERNVPGPGKYEIKTIFGEDSPKFSLGGRPEENKFSDFKSRVPPPGEYRNVLGINAVGKYPVSNVKGATNILFGASKDKRFNYKCEIHLFVFFYSFFLFEEDLSDVAFFYLFLIFVIFNAVVNKDEY